MLHICSKVSMNAVDILHSCFITNEQKWCAGSIVPAYTAFQLHLVSTDVCKLTKNSIPEAYASGILTKLRLTISMLQICCKEIEVFWFTNGQSIYLAAYLQHMLQSCCWHILFNSNAWVYLFIVWPCTHFWCSVYFWKAFPALVLTMH